MRRSSTVGLATLLLLLGACSSTSEPEAVRTGQASPSSASELQRFRGARPNGVALGSQVLYSDNTAPATFTIADLDTGETRDVAQPPVPVFRPALAVVDSRATVVGTACSNVTLQGVEPSCEPGGLVAYELDLDSASWEMVADRFPGVDGQWYATYAGSVEHKLVISASELGQGGLEVFKLNPASGEVEHLKSPKVVPLEAADARTIVCADNHGISVAAYSIVDVGGDSGSVPGDPYSAASYDADSGDWSDPVATGEEWDWSAVGLGQLMCHGRTPIAVGNGPDERSTAIFEPGPNAWRVSRTGPVLGAWFASVRDAASVLAWMESRVSRLELDTLTWTEVGSEEGTVASAAVTGDRIATIQFEAGDDGPVVVRLSSDARPS